MKISIAEGLYLIALDDEEGRLLAAAEKTIVPGLISAAILELHLLKKVGLKDNKISSVEQSGTGNGILDGILRKLKTGLNFLDAVEDLSHHFKDIQEDLNQLLVQRGILKKEATKLMWIPLSERMDNANYSFEQDIRNSLKTIVFKSAKPTISFVILMSLIYDCQILSEVFRDKDELIDAVKVAKDMVDSPVLTPEVSTALKELKKYFGN
ncbi:GPP34 family phosphoprotein [Marinoscillum sp. 108]|uniref:GOLPH3/VPS74 family protein n=1 Tax=Marinoscillum sp. 108 TaxID=2653151 RepID=UPI0012F2820E|nr:GPP34 family phosphoprotein [Marinoscillum sp. 108]VXD12561.1 Golgi phosphoprotein 3 GPP34 [Marinoscillum sp. 108]